MIMLISHKGNFCKYYARQSDNDKNMDILLGSYYSHFKLKYRSITFLGVRKNVAFFIGY